MVDTERRASPMVGGSGGTPTGVELGPDSQVRKTRHRLPGDREQFWAGRQHVRGWLALGKCPGTKQQQAGASLKDNPHSTDTLSSGVLQDGGGGGKGAWEEARSGVWRPSQPHSP